MKLRLHDLRGRSEGVQVREQVALGDLGSRDRSLVALEAVDAELTACESSGVYRVEGTLTTRATYRCSRCLREFREPLVASFAEAFVRESAGAKGERDDEEGPIPVSGDEIDLAPYIEQTIVLALPWRPLCNPECAGLCPDCGTNLNEGLCGCRDGALDPRWEKLGELWNRMSGSSGGNG